jgi:alkylation response protein AidB-like acyl-CoA dehydrogenase
MGAIGLLGSDQQKERWLRQLASSRRSEPSALTKPDHGSDVVGLATGARADRDGWVIDGAKRWLGNGSIADLVIVWATDDDEDVGGFVVEREAVDGNSVDRSPGSSSFRTSSPPGRPTSQASAYPAIAVVYGCASGARWDRAL